MAIPSRAAERNGRRGDHTKRKDHTICTMPTSGGRENDKNLSSARKGENVLPTAHEGQNAYHRYHAYQLVTESVRLAGRKPGCLCRSDQFTAKQLACVALPASQLRIPQCPPSPGRDWRIRNGQFKGERGERLCVEMPE